MDVKFTSRDSCDNAYFSLKDLSIELLESVIEALHDESNIVLVHYSHSFLLLILIVYELCAFYLQFVAEIYLDNL
ncbi:hypothetical protein ACFX13_029026 [Malus domestica]